MTNNSYFNFIFASKIGNIGFVKSNVGIRRIFLPNQYPKSMIKRFYPKSILKPMEFDDLSDELIRYFEGKRVSFQNIHVDLRGISLFANYVLSEVQNISYGKIQTYCDIALNIGKENAHRAVGRALAKNPLPIIIPCHRIIGMDGTLHGYIGSLQMKKFLLELEGNKKWRWNL